MSLTTYYTTIKVWISGDCLTFEDTSQKDRFIGPRLENGDFKLTTHSPWHVNILKIHGDENCSRLRCYKNSGHRDTGLLSVRHLILVSFQHLFSGKNTETKQTTTVQQDRERNRCTEICRPFPAPHSAHCPTVSSSSWSVWVEADSARERVFTLEYWQG